MIATEPIPVPEELRQVQAHPGGLDEAVSAVYKRQVYSYEAKPGTEESILAKISDICISMQAEDYLELPDLTYHEVLVELDKKSWKAYQDLERKMILELPEDDELISVTSAAALSNKLWLLYTSGFFWIWASARQSPR